MPQRLGHLLRRQAARAVLVKVVEGALDAAQELVKADKILQHKGAGPPGRVWLNIIIIIIEGLSLLQSIPPTTADKQTQALWLNKGNVIKPNIVNKNKNAIGFTRVE